MPVTSCPDAIAKALEKVLKVSKGTHEPAPAPISAATKAVAPIPRPGMTPAEAKLAKFCPECGAKLEHEGGCVTCRDCGYSKCGENRKGPAPAGPFCNRVRIP